MLLVGAAFDPNAAIGIALGLVVFAIAIFYEEVITQKNLAVLDELLGDLTPMERKKGRRNGSVRAENGRRREFSYGLSNCFNFCHVVRIF